MNKRNLLIAIFLFLTLVMAGCSRTKTVKTKETKQFTKAILESNEKVKSLEFYFTKPYLNAEIIYEPDLVLVQLADGTLGYVRNEDLIGEVPNTPEEAVAMQIEKENRIQGARGLKTGRTINVYDVNGEIVLGEFFISDGLPVLINEIPPESK